MLLTIGIITLNRSKCLVQTIAAFLSQIDHWEETELLICDNASTDDTFERMSELQLKFPKIKYERNATNLGFSGNVLKTVQLATGEYVWFFADDDLILDGTLARVLTTLRTYQPAILYLNHYAFDEGAPEVVVQKCHVERDHVFKSGFEFFKVAGLGFLSSLLVKKTHLDEFRPKVEPARNNAHLEMAAYTALSKPGPFVFLGTVSVAARRPQTAAYNILIEGHVRVLRIYEQLVKDGLLSKSYFADWRHRDLIYGVFRGALFQYTSGNFRNVIASEPALRNVYGEDWAYPVTVGLLCRLPVWLVNGPYKLLRSIYRNIRIQLYKFNRKPNSK
jgi:glycosyltransferase involved in cell wall biosynthesis